MSIRDRFGDSHGFGLLAAAAFLGLAPVVAIGVADTEPDILNSDIAAVVSPASVSGPSWSSSTSYPLTIEEAAITTVAGKVYMFGGFYKPVTIATKQANVYDPSSRQWSPLADLPEYITHAAAVADGNTIWLIGGYVGNSPGPSTSRVYKYDIPANSYSIGPSLPTHRGAGAAVKNGRSIHFFGGATRTAGKTDDRDRGEHWQLSLDGGGWSQKATLPNARNHLGGINLNGKLYAVGGRHGYEDPNGFSNDLHRYDPSSNTWAQLKDLPEGRAHLGGDVIAVDGLLITFGGDTRTKPYTNDVLAYDPSSNSWRRLSSLPEGRKANVAINYDNDHVLVVGGIGSSGRSTKAWVGTL